MNSIPESRQRTALRRRLLDWYDAHKRDLPWRRTRDPYAIWVAEIMLQQTRVAAVLEHYREFLKRFPMVKSLAQARPSAVLAAWSGLGYYRRARALQAAAQIVVREFGGRLPATEGELALLPGVGRYTAAAIASTAFGRCCAVVDGNVERVLGRLFKLRITPQQLWRAADQLLSRRRPGDFNQAMMELGATVCLPVAPLCDACPLQRWCVTRGAMPRKLPIARRKRRIRYVLAVANERVFLVQRAAAASIIPLMWELPPAASGERGRRVRFQHSITNTDYDVTVVAGSPPAGTSGRWISFARLRQLPLTGLARKILRRDRLI